ncbi:MAG: TetR/AcrR family transcriptional regulator [Thermocrispum sp.]
MAAELGLRERKKQQTRRLIAETAFALFAESGFDGVTVAQVARAADVSEATVFNYFRTKEALFYRDMEDFAELGVQAVRDRAPGVSAVSAYRDFVVQPRGWLDGSSPNGFEQLAKAARIVADSPTLRARERQVLDETTARLAAVLVADTSADVDAVEPWVVANALVGVHRAVKDYLHRQVLTGRRDDGLTQDVLANGKRAFDLLEAGLRKYPS